jgi:DNA modification methylase
MKNDHPAPYPLILPVRCIQAVLQEPGVVFDPYNGSGTTGVAANMLGHDYIGFDVSEKYIEEARERITNHTKRDIQKFNDARLTTTQSNTDSMLGQLTS